MSSKPKLYKAMGSYYVADNPTHVRQMLRCDYTRAELVKEKIERITGKFKLYNLPSDEVFEIDADDIGEYFTAPCMIPEC